MVQLKRTDSKNQDFIDLVSELDTYLKTVDGDDHDFYHQYNNIDVLKHVVIVYENNIPTSCGAFKAYGENSVEIKRMYTKPIARGNGFAAKVLNELENWAKELNYNSCILETGKRQVEAVQFYNKNNYKPIANYGQYRNVENSVCFEKILK